MKIFLFTIGFEVEFFMELSTAILNLYHSKTKIYTNSVSPHSVFSVDWLIKKSLTFN